MWTEVKRTREEWPPKMSQCFNRKIRDWLIFGGHCRVWFWLFIMAGGYEHEPPRSIVLGVGLVFLPFMIRV